MLLVNVPPVPKSAGWLVVHVSVLGGAGTGGAVALAVAGADCPLGMRGSALRGEPRLLMGHCFWRFSLRNLVTPGWRTLHNCFAYSSGMSELFGWVQPSRELHMPLSEALLSHHPSIQR